MSKLLVALVGDVIASSNLIGDIPFLDAAARYGASANDAWFIR